MNSAPTDIVRALPFTEPPTVPLARARSFACREECGDRRMQAQIHVFPVKEAACSQSLHCSDNLNSLSLLYSVCGLLNFLFNSSVYIT
jgi:hypothetical protein